MVDPYKQYVTKEKNTIEDDDDDFDEVCNHRMSLSLVYLSVDNVEILL